MSLGHPAHLAEARTPVDISAIKHHITFSTNGPESNSNLYSLLPLPYLHTNGDSCGQVRQNYQ